MAATVEQDQTRDAWFAAQGFRILRFWNNDVLANPAGVLEQIPPMTAPDPGFGLYVHWPFCKAKCPYCDFNSHVREAVDQTRWRAALLRELAHYAERIGRRPLTSIFFGGGTPSLMPPATAAAVIETAETLLGFAPDIEITLEANPTSAEATAFAGFAAAGVNRLSLGVQALNDTDLAFLGRQHSAAEALAAVALARRSVPRISFDLIYARPGQSQEAWRQELEVALAEGAEHLSLYQLTLEENTVFHARARRGELSLPPEEQQAELFEATQAILTAAGLPAYEVSNHARSGAACRHNLTYWRYGDYLGIGPGAHGRVTVAGDKQATRQHRAPEAWLEQVEAEGHATRQNEKLSTRQRLEEMLLMGLRLVEGVPLAAIERETGAPLRHQLSAQRLDKLRREGLITRDEETLAATPEGWQRLNAVLDYLLAGDQ